jgi:organic radical activating enzyme
MYTLDRAEFYITNVCNLNCPDCNRFNNFAFKGHEKWEEYQEEYKKWADIVDIKETDIIGGEPMSNPDFLTWIHKLHELWPKAKMTVWTNGHYLKRWPELLNIMNVIDKDFKIIIAGHNVDTFLNELSELETWLGSLKKKSVAYNLDIWKQRYSKSRQPTWPDCDHPDDFWNLPVDIQEECTRVHIIHPMQLFTTIYQTDKNLTVEWFPNLYYYQSSLQYTQDKFYWFDSDPSKAYEVCYFKTCPHFSRGKFYKCGMTGILPDFINQFEIDVPDYAKKLIDSYQPADPSWNQPRLIEFLDNIKYRKPITQCRLCPENLKTGKPLRATEKKIKLIKKQPYTPTYNN